MTTIEPTSTQPELNLSDKAKLFIKVQIASSSARYFFWTTLLSILPAIFALVVVTQGQFQLQTWAIALVFMGMSTIIGLTMWRWVMNRDIKKELNKEEKLYGDYINTDLIDEVVDAPKFKLFNSLSVLRIIFAFIGILLINMAVTSLYSVATYQTQEYEITSVITQGSIGASLLIASFILNLVINQTVKLYTNNGEPKPETNQLAETE